MIGKKLILALGCALLMTVALVGLNPGNILTDKSTGYSAERFDELVVGGSVQAAVARLGKPISVRPAGSIGDCDKCSVYLFLGNPPRWVISYEEAWLLVDDHGVVVRKIRTSEP